MNNVSSFNIFSKFYYNFIRSFRNIYKNSNLYENKISKTFNNQFEYKPSPHLLSSIIKYQNKKYKVEDFSINSIWKETLNKKDFYKLQNFFWFFSLDLKSSKTSSQSIISNWIKYNNKYNKNSWEVDITAKRIISWLSNHQLTYENSNDEYRSIFDHMIQKQTNHLLNEINNSENFENKMIICAAIILTGLAYKDEKRYLENGLNILKKIFKSSIDNEGFPKSRNINQLVFYLKYIIIIREWFKESQNIIPEFIDENIYYLGSCYACVWQNIKQDLFYNGNYISENEKFDQYLKRFGYKFKNENKEIAGYSILRNKKTILSMDIGSSPNKNFSSDYQSGALSFEIISNQKKLITNCGYFSDINKKYNKLCRSTALHNTLIIEDFSSCDFKKIDSNYELTNGVRVVKKNTIFEENYWKISGFHEGYLKKFGVIHEREIEFYPEQEKFIGTDKILRRKPNKEIKFDIRFQLHPISKVMKTQNNKSILIELEDEGWRFSCDNFDKNIDNGLYFGNKNSYTENHNIYISGINNEEKQIIKWEISKLK
tara:strand:+ start:1053 stop:2681 length:1629 start_codon:yes stop_codon:yes gene_type:complete